MEVSDQHHALATFALGKYPGMHWLWTWVVTGAGLENLEMHTKIFGVNENVEEWNDHVDGYMFFLMLNIVGCFSGTLRTYVRMCETLCLSMSALVQCSWHSCLVTRWCQNPEEQRHVPKICLNVTSSVCDPKLIPSIAL